MSVRKLKPITPGQRFRVVNGFDAITTDKPEKSLLAPNKRSGGRNNQGKNDHRNIGGGHKKSIVLSILKEISTGVSCNSSINRIRSKSYCIYCIIKYADGEKRYVIAQKV